MNFQAAHHLAGGSGYAYDLDALAKHLLSIRAEGVRPWFACKANPLSAILEVVKESGFSFDVASLGELEQVVRVGADPQKIILTGPVKTEAFLKRALDLGVCWFVAESREQLSNLSRLAEGRELNILLRLQLDWAAGESVLGGSQITAFGLSPVDWGDLPALPGIHYRGVHVFQWGNIQAAEDLGAIWERIALVAKEFSAAQGFPLEVLDLGGGLGIPYDGEGLSFSWAAVVPWLQSARAISGAGELWLELGRYAVGPFGYYFTPIVERKTVRGENFLLCTGGAHHMVRPALVKESFPMRIEGREGATEKFHVHGPLCTALDRLGTFDLPATAAPGDLCVFSQAGAYGFTESMPYFLCHEGAAELIWRNGDWRVVRERTPASAWLR